MDETPTETNFSEELEKMFKVHTTDFDEAEIFTLELLIESDIVHFFPTRHKRLKKYLKCRCKDLKEAIRTYRQSQNFWNQTITNWNDQWWLETIVYIFDKHIERLERQLSQYRWQLRKLEHPTQETVGAGLSQYEIDTAKRVPITEFHQGRLRRTGGLLRGHCPFHDDSTPSFTIYPKQNSWHCYGCSIGGSVIDYIMRANDMKFLEAAKFILKK